MTVLNTPLISVSELKKSPTKAFQRAKWNQTGVFVIKHDQMLGVLLSLRDYDKIMKEIDELRWKVYNAGIEHNMNITFLIYIQITSFWVQRLTPIRFSITTNLWRKVTN